LLFFNNDRSIIINRKKEIMKKRFLLLITMVIILVIIQACSAGPGAQPTIVEQQVTLAGEPTNSTDAPTPSQEADAVGIPEGPETIDLTNSVLYVPSSTPAYTFDVVMNFSGVTSTGTAKEVTLSMGEMTQTLPQKGKRFLVVVTGGEGSAETVIVGDQGYSVFLGTCSQFSATSSEGQNASGGMPKLQDLFTGQALRVDTGIEVNGLITDKYELTGENMLEKDELVSAFVYVARVGGFITLFEAQTRTKTDYQGFDPNQLTDLNIAHNYIPVEDGSLVITIPTICAN
jgi:hypothetical protein